MYFLIVFLAVFQRFSGSFWREKWIKNRVVFSIEFLMDFGRVFAMILEGFLD